MIEFKGKISAKCKKYILRRESETALKGGLIAISIFFVPIIIYSFLVNWIFVIGLPVLGFILFCAAMPPLGKSQEKILPTHLIIDDDEIISESPFFSYVRSFSEVKQVLDMGEWYHIIFFYPARNPRFVLQKDLIVQGTIEEFEKLFEDYLVVK